MKPLDTLDKCTTCSTCVAYCPVTRATRTFRGPKLTGPSSERFRLFEEDSEIEALDACSNCKNCDIVCPSGVSISTLNMMARGDYCRVHKPPLRDWVLAHGSRFGGLARLFPGALVRFGMTNPLTRRLLDWFGVARRAPLPVYAPKSFHQRLAAHRAVHQRTFTKKVIFFPGCYISDYDPETGMDLVLLLERAGYQVLVPSPRCCGVPLVANGFMDEAEEAARLNSTELAALAEPEVPILSMCPSCALMLGQEYEELFPSIPYAAGVASRITDACDFVMQLLKTGELTLNPRQPEGSFMYHAPCHLRAQGIGKPGLELMRMIPGLTIRDAQAGCCGISGSYGFKKEKYEIAAAVGSDLFQTIKTSGATQCVTECGTCRIQITHHTGLPSIHPLSLLRRLCEK